MDPKDKVEVPADELELEQEAAQEKKEDEVRAAVIADFGFDAVDDADKIEKLTKERMTAHSKLSTAIGQKIKHRDAPKVAPVVPVVKPVVEPAKPVESADVSKVVTETLEQRDLDAMELPDDIKAEIKRVAQIQGVSVTKAARDPYIVTKIEDHKKSIKNDDAALGRTNRGTGGGGKRNWSVTTPPDIDVSTPEGQKEWKEYLTWAQKEEAKG